MSELVEAFVVGGAVALVCAFLISAILLWCAGYDAGRKSTEPRCGEQLKVACTRPKLHLGRCRTVHQPNRYAEPRVVRWRA